VQQTTVQQTTVQQTTVPPFNERRAAAVITGASSGVGSALALRFAESVERVILIGRDAERLQATARAVEQRGARSQCHVAELDSVPSVDALSSELGRLAAVSALIHAAGEFSAESVAALDPADFDRILRVNLRAPYVLTRALLPALQQGQGDVVFINSSVVGQRRAGLAAYGGSKAGLVALADSVRQECNPLGLRVLSVFLGATATPMQRNIHEQQARAYQPEALLQPENVAQIVHAALALPRGAEVTDLHLRPAVAHRP
jgi:short-subunit dehydrogenase